MNARERILKQLKDNRPDLAPLPQVSFGSTAGENMLDTFKSSLKAVGGQPIDVSSAAEVVDRIRTNAGSPSKIVNLSSLIQAAEAVILGDKSKASLQDIDIAIMDGEIGVAENAAIWVTEERMGHRAIPFICQHLVILLRADRIVPTMHDAYKTIKPLDSGFGVFISGPSKTADIEQSLVIGAHGARSLTVYLVS